MLRNLADFIRGSQLLGSFGFMFAAGIKAPIIIALAAIAGMSWWTLSSGLSDYESYLVGMKFYAMAYLFMEFDPSKLVTLQTGFGGTFQLPISRVQEFPSVIDAWRHMIALVRSAAVRSILVLLPLFGLFWWYAAHFGKRAKELRHQRGASMAALSELIHQVRVHNRNERASEFKALLGRKWRLCLPSELARLLPYRPSHIAGVPYPWRLEQSHAMLIGTTGMGKTVAISDMIAEARKRGQRAVIFDLTGAFIEQFYDPDRDTILNPLDARCPQWSVFDECQDESEFSAIAQALVPHDGGGSEQFWVLAARLLFVEMCLKLQSQGKTTNAALAQELMTADLKKVHAMMQGTVADPITAPEAARMAESIRAVFNANARALKLLPAAGEHFSIRDWVEEDAADGGMVFISARYVDMSVCSQLLTVWLDIAMNTLMTLERTRDLRMWFFIDEMGALHRLPALEKGLQTARNFGGAIVTGIHAFAKLKDVYGEDMAITLSALARTKLILGTADRDTATWCADFIGYEEVRDIEEGYTYGYNNARDAVSLTGRKHVRPLRLPDELMNLKKLTGYLKFPDGFPAAQVKLKPVDRLKRAKPFIKRAVDKPGRGDKADPAETPKPDPQGGPDGAAANPSENDDGAGKSLENRQGNLPLAARVGDTVDARERVPVADLQASQDRLGAQDEAQTGTEVKNVPEHARTDSEAHGSGVALALTARHKADPGGEAAPDQKTPEQLGNRQPGEPGPKPGMAKLPEPSSATGSEARRLMLEDGLAERTEPEIGDLDLDM